MVYDHFHWDVTALLLLIKQLRAIYSLSVDNLISGTVFESRGKKVQR